MAELTHTQTRRVVATGYEVEDRITAATAIPAEVFVFRAEDGAFSRVASVGDLETVPAGNTPGAAYFRADSVTRVFPNLSDAISFGQLLKSRLKLLVVEYTKAQDLFVGSETEQVTA